MLVESNNKSGYSYWRTHDYTRRSIKIDFLTFCGWDVLEDLVNNLDPLPRCLVCALFETGGRATEILTLRPEQFDRQDDHIMVRRMKVLKQKEKEYLKNPDGSFIIDQNNEKKYIWKPKPTDRTFPLPYNEPLIEPLMEYVDTIPANRPLFDFSYSKLYRIIRDLQKPPDIKHGPWWPHRFRGERATQLVIDKNFTVLDLMNWFGWKRQDMPAFYVGLSAKDLVRKIVEGR